LDAIINLIAEIKKCEEAGANTAAFIMCFVCMDTMAFLGMPEDRDRNTREDFIQWVDEYLKAYLDQPYQYRGKDVYAARCSVLHSFSAEGAGHRDDPTLIKFVYSTGGVHGFNPDIDDSLVVIGTASFINDVVCAVEAFLKVAQENSDLRARISSRLDKLFIATPVS